MRGMANMSVRCKYAVCNISAVVLEKIRDACALLVAMDEAAPGLNEEIALFTLSFTEIGQI